MEERNLACGTWPLIGHGIETYVLEHGCKPVALIVPIPCMGKRRFPRNAT